MKKLVLVVAMFMFVCGGSSPPMSMIQLSQTLHQKTNRLSLSRNNLANNMQDIVCRRIVSTLQKKPSLLSSIPGMAFLLSYLLTIIL